MEVDKTGRDVLPGGVDSAGRPGGVDVVTHGRHLAVADGDRGDTIDIVGGVDDMAAGDDEIVGRSRCAVMAGGVPPVRGSLRLCFRQHTGRITVGKGAAGKRAVPIDIRLYDLLRCRHEHEALATPPHRLLRPDHRASSTGRGRPGATPAAFKALGDGTRLSILRLIAAQPEAICACDIVDRFDVSQPTIAHHLKVLRQAGLITVSRRGIWAYYALDPQGAELLESAAGRILAGETRSAIAVS